jgi:hypothetical protein
MKRIFLLISVSVWVQWFAACAGSDVKNLANVALKEKYLLAVKDAEVAEASEISTSLTAIVPTNKELVWKTIGKEGYVKMVTWTSWDGYAASKGKEIPLSREIWVTAAPKVQDFCKKKEGFDASLTVLRLEQLLGLPPGNQKTRFVEFWIKPSDMFRPSPDAEITDTKAELDYPKGTKEDHKKWIESLKASSYGQEGYPWTRLGYTYDWGNPKSEVGLSEFVVKSGSKVFVESDVLNDEYCK